MLFVKDYIIFRKILYNYIYGMTKEKWNGK